MCASILSRLSIVTSPAARPRLDDVTSQVQGHVRHRKTELLDFVTTRWRSQRARAVYVNEKADTIYVVCLLKKA